MNPTIEKTNGGYILRSKSLSIFCRDIKEIDEAIEIFSKNDDSPTGFEHNLYYLNRGFEPPPEECIQ